MKNNSQKIGKSATKNACKLCNPLGACMVFKGIEGAVPFLHGSQGCATYMRRYLISHFKEPIDIASSNFTEHTTIFGGEANLKTGINNVISAYSPKLIGLATTCLSETIGEDVPRMVTELKLRGELKDIPVICVSSPSYSGTHIDGFHNAVLQTVKTLSVKDKEEERINVFSGYISPEDIRNTKDILSEIGIDYTLLPDYSETLDGAIWENYIRLPEGGTPLEDIKRSANAKASIEFGYTHGNETAGVYLDKAFNVKNYRIGYPIGVNETDKFFSALSEITGLPVPVRYEKQRGRLIDAYVDGHKYVSGKKAVVYGEEDLVIGITAFLAEIGIKPVLIASGGESGNLEKYVYQVAPKLKNNVRIREGYDFNEIEEEAGILNPDIIIGSSKGYQFARRMNLPLIRIGFPIHDRIGGGRIEHLFYKGALSLFDKIANAFIEKRQEESNVGYSYI